MDRQTAIIGEISGVAQAFSAAGLPAIVCPEQSPRDVLRWAMDLEAGSTGLCLVVESAGVRLEPVETALDPQIPLVCWVSPDNRQSFAAPTATRALISFADSAETLIAQVQGLGGAVAGVAAAPRVIPVAAQPAAASAESADTTAPDDTEDDHALLRKLEAEMSAGVKTAVRAEPVPVQASGIDFSIPLRELMSQGKAAAEKLNHPEVLGIHYLAALDEPYLSEFAQAGLNPSGIETHLKEIRSDAAPDTEPVVSDEVFSAVDQAKKFARERNGAFIKVSDFLRGLLDISAGSVAQFTEQHGLSLAALMGTINRLDGNAENHQESFFAPSSYDQDYFYQFDNGRLKDVEARLQNLPAFKAASRPAKSAGGRKSAAPAGEPTGAGMQRTAAPPPEKPEVLRINSDFPSVDVIEQVVDELLEGQVVAFSGDIMLALVADAANPAAVERLREAVPDADERRLSILVHSTSQLKHLVRADLDPLEPLLDELWPGPLTLVFNAGAGLGRQLVRDGKIAIRLPSDNISLALLSMLGRPLAVTSWDEPGGMATLTQKLQGLLGVAIDSGETPAPQVTTVVDLTKTPWKVLREGAVPATAIENFRN